MARPGFLGGKLKRRRAGHLGGYQHTAARKVELLRLCAMLVGQRNGFARALIRARATVGAIVRVHTSFAVIIERNRFHRAYFGTGAAPGALVKIHYCCHHATFLIFSTRSVFPSRPDIGNRETRIG
jgi:hypothetical protein